MVALKSLFFATFIANFKHSVGTVAAVEADIARISVQVKSLDSSITAFRGSLIDALAIKTAVGDLVSAINTATTDTVATPATDVTEDDANRIMADLNGSLKPAILGALKRAVLQKPVFATLLIVIDATSLVLHSLKSLQTAVYAFEAALIAVAPADFKDKAQALASEINAAIDTAITDYS